MLPSSPLAALSILVRQGAQNARLNAAILKKNEAATRATLIDPVLRALGWDTTNVRMVEPEKTIGSDLRVDYLLYDALGKPRFVVEAKCLGENLDKHGYVSKILGYALGFKVQTVFITDGLTWHCYTGPQLGAANEPLVFELSEENPVPAALALVQLLDAANCGYFLPASSSVPASVASTVAERAKQESAFTSAPKNKVQGETQKAVRPTVVSASHFIPITHTNEFPGGQKPTQLRLPDGSVRALTTWKDVLLECCYFVLATVPNLKLPYPDKAGRKRFLLNLSKPAVGSSTPASYFEENIFIGTHYSAPDCLANALHILKRVLPANQKMEAAIAF